MRSPARPSSPTRERSSRHRARMSPSQPTFSSAKSTSRSTVSMQNWLSGFWNRIETSRLRSRGPISSTARPPASTSPEDSPAYAGYRPARHSASVDLPLPEAPMTRTTSPRPTVRERSENTGSVFSP